jgi:hypothetical protein
VVTRPGSVTEIPIEQMSHCRNCGTEVSPEKAWCPNCNQPLEAEEIRPVAREIDTFAGTLINEPRPSASVAAEPIPTVRVSVPILKVPDRIVAPLASTDSHPPSVSTKEMLAVPSRSWVYILVGALIGVIVLAILAGVGVGIWRYWG